MSDPRSPDQGPSRSPAPGPSTGGALGAAEGRGEWRRLLVLVAATLLLWGPGSIPGSPGPAFDDREAVVGNPVVDGSLPALAAFDRDYWHHLEDAGHFRPLATLLLRWDRSGSPAGAEADPDWARFRRTNVALHGLIVLLLGAALIRLQRSRGLTLPWVGLALFALHPVNADVVSWISGRTSLVSALGAAVGVLGVTYLPRGSRAVAPLAALVAFLGCALALLGKEDGVVLIPVLPAVAACCAGRRAGFGALLGGLTALLAVAALRHHALGSALPSSPSAPLASYPITDRLVLGLAAWWTGLGELLTPWGAWPPSVHLADLEGRPGPWVRAAGLLLAGLVAAGALARQAARQTGRARLTSAAALVSLGAVALAMAPLLQIIPAGELFAPRFLYQPLLLGCFATAALLEVSLRWIPSPMGRGAAQLVLLAVCAAAVPTSASTYQSRASFWSAHLPQHADDPRVWNDLGNAARESGDLSQARAAFERAIALDPTYSRPWTNLGTLALAEGDLIEAELQLRAAVTAGPDNAVARGNLGNVLLRAGAFEEAAQQYRRAVTIAPGRAAYHRGLGRALGQAGDLEGARAALERALALHPGDRRARAELARLGLGL